MDIELDIPAYYVCGRHQNEEEKQKTHSAMQMTPVSCVLITDYMDMEYAREFSEVVIKVDGREAHTMAQKIAKETSRPVMVIGTANFLWGYNVHGERLPWQLSGASSSIVE